MDLNKLALLNSIAQEKAELEKKSRLVKREIDFVEYTKKYTDIIENLIYSMAQENKKYLNLWVRNRDGDTRVYIDNGNNIPTEMRVDYNIYISDWIHIPLKDVDKLEFINKGRPANCAINALAFMYVIDALKEQGFSIEYYSYIASGTSVRIKWSNMSCNTEYEEDDYDIAKLKKKYERLKELNDMANNIIAE